MEPSDLNPFAPEDEPLKSLLAAHTPALRDDGFSARVVAALPPRNYAATHAGALPLWLCACGALAGLVFAAAKGSSWSALSVGVAGLANAFAPVVAALTDPWTELALAITGLSLLLTFAIDRQRTRWF